MKVFGLSLVILAMAASLADAAPGDTWILGIHHIDNRVAFTTFTGAGYSGPQSSGHMDFIGNAYGRSIPAGAPDGVARVWWELSGNATSSGRRVPTTTELYSLEFYGTTEPGHNGWQPVESQLRGAGGPDAGGFDPLIPWAGNAGTNHQWLGSTGKDDGDWHPMDNDGEGGPQAPFSAAMNAPPDGTYMWLKANSWLYAKWDFLFPINRSWSALRLTQFTGPVPLEGDYNDDGSVDAADYTVWRKTGINGQDGYNIWRANFGMTNEAGGAAELIGASTAPEPASAALLVLGLVGLLWLAMTRRKHTSASCICVRAAEQHC